MAKRVGIREAKARLSYYIERAREGHPVVITDRGKPVVKLVPLLERDQPTEDDVLDDLEAMGILERGQGDSWKKPIEVVKPRKGGSVSALVRKMRR
jgi:prevent-host-death family protein